MALALVKNNLNLVAGCLHLFCKTVYRFDRNQLILGALKDEHWRQPRGYSVCRRKCRKLIPDPLVAIAPVFFGAVIDDGIEENKRCHFKGNGKVVCGRIKAVAHNGRDGKVSSCGSSAHCYPVRIDSPFPGMCPDPSQERFGILQ